LSAQLAHGRRLSVHMSTNPTTHSEKIQVVVRPVREIGNPEESYMTMLVLSWLGQSVLTSQIVDRGHTHSDRSSVVEFFLKHRSPSVSVLAVEALPAPSEGGPHDGCDARRSGEPSCTDSPAEHTSCSHSHRWTEDFGSLPPEMPRLAQESGSARVPRHVPLLGQVTAMQDYPNEVASLVEMERMQAEDVMSARLNTQWRHRYRIRVSRQPLSLQRWVRFTLVGIRRSNARGGSSTNDRKLSRGRL
jgi:hypothetical protein